MVEHENCYCVTRQLFETLTDSDKASKPGKPQLDDWDKDHVDLHWAPPENNGGAPIEKYIVEKRTKYGR